MKKKSSHFDKFAKKKSNAAIKEQFKQEKRKWKKEREEFFEKKRSQSAVGSRQSAIPKYANQNSDPDGYRDRTQNSELMPLNKFIAHCGVSSRRDAAETVKLGKVKVNGETITEPGRKVSAKDEVIVNGKKVSLAKKSHLHTP